MFGWPNGHGGWSALGERRYVELHGCKDPTPVTVTTDPEGDYLGWIGKGKGTPIMILHKQIFEVQFPYGSAAEVARDRGTVVWIRVEVSEP
jgi:hypothetical protein